MFPLRTKGFLCGLLGGIVIRNVNLALKQNLCLPSSLKYILLLADLLMAVQQSYVLKSAFKLVNNIVDDDRYRLITQTTSISMTFKYCN
jgi:small-conductance mechanosensitive channel